MELQQAVNLVIGVIVAAGGGTWAGYLAGRKKSNAEAEGIEVDSAVKVILKWQELYNIQEQKLIAYDAKLQKMEIRMSEMERELREERQKVVDLTSQLNKHNMRRT